VIETRRTVVFVLALAASLFVTALLAGPAAASPCGNRVLKDWSGNSRIDGTYPLHCYQDAIDALPSDLRDYSDALDVIGRAFRAAGGRSLAISEKPGKNQQVSELDPGTVSDASSPSSLPIPLLVLGGVALALLAAGGAGYVARRRRGVDE
jgi:hypothetical protein